MAKRLRAAIDIDASPHRVWQVLTDTSGYPAWNPFVRKFRGKLREGSRVRVWLKLYPWGTVRFEPVIIRLEPERELRWRATLGWPGVFDVDRRFIIEERPGGGVRFEQGEDCSGFLTPVMFALDLERRIVRGYASMNRALKARAENSGSPESGSVG